jgi:hypothetical protein
MWQISRHLLERLERFSEGSPAFTLESALSFISNRGKIAEAPSKVFHTEMFDIVHSDWMSFTDQYVEYPK